MAIQSGIISLQYHLWYCILLVLMNFRNVLNDVKIMRISGVYHFYKRTNY